MKTIKKFLADPSLGRLSRWLRILGFDAVYFSNPLDEKLFFEKARDENRLILTRSGKIITQLNKINIKIAQPSESSGLLISYYFITHNHVNDQLDDLIGKGLILQPEHWFTRCTECNEILKEVDREEVHGKVPDYIRETQEGFRQCPHCKKIFWEGTHCKRMKEKIKFLFNH